MYQQTLLLKRSFQGKNGRSKPQNRLYKRIKMYINNNLSESDPSYQGVHYKVSTC